MRASLCFLALTAITGISLVNGCAEAGEEKIPLDKLPKAVVEAVKKRFPKAELTAAAKETVDKKTEYEVILKNEGQKIDVTLTPEGIILGMEKEISAKDLPKAVTKTLKKSYPKAAYKKVEEVIKVKDDKETLAFYEVLLETADKKTMEVKIEADGKLLGGDKQEGEQKEEKKENGRTVGGWTEDFTAERADLISTGRNPYFILEPGFQRILEGDGARHVLTVLDETKLVDGVETRVVIEHESKDGKVAEISRNYYAISKRTNSVYYFGEHVDIYKNGKIVGNEGSWLSGEKGARFGLMMPGLPLVGAKYQQEVAPGTAMDRAMIVSVNETVKTPAGEFKNCLKIEETTPLEPGNVGQKYYAPGIGLIQDGALKLVSYGKAESTKK